MGGDSESVLERLKGSFKSEMTLKEALRSAIAALSGADRKLSQEELEVAVLERNGRRRCFRRIEDSEIQSLVG